MDAQIVGERIAKLRKSQNKTQKQLADELSVTYKAVSKWETGAGLPDIAMLPALASALNVSADEIVSGLSDVACIKDNQKNADSRVSTFRRYIRKPAAIVTISSLVIALAASVIIFNYLKANKDLDYDEGIGIHVIYDDSSGFGVTAEHAKEIYDMQLAADIRTLLLQSYQIDDATVIVNTAEASPFRLQENDNKPNVSVILTIADTYTLSDIDMQTIEDLIKAAIPGIKDGYIKIS